MYAQIANRKIHYKKFGRGRPIIFVHGWGGSLYSLHSLAMLASREYTSILIDLPGFGKSDNPPPHWGVEGYAELVALFLKKINVTKPIYIGHSFGGEVGIYLTSHMPDLIDTLILCNSSFKREKKISKLARILKNIPEDKRTFLKYVEPFIKKVYYKLLHRDSDLMKYPHLETNFRKIVTQDLTADSKKIAIPTLIIWGENDTYTPVLWAYELERNIKGSKLKIFPYRRHNLPLKYPDEVWQEIKAFSITMGI